MMGPTDMKWLKGTVHPTHAAVSPNEFNPNTIRKQLERPRLGDPSQEQWPAFFETIKVKKDQNNWDYSRFKQSMVPDWETFCRQ
jgi:hypothetical protein